MVQRAVAENTIHYLTPEDIKQLQEAPESPTPLTPCALNAAATYRRRVSMQNHETVLNI